MFFSVRQRLFLSRCLRLTRTPFYIFFIVRQDWYHILRDVEDAIPYIFDDETFSSQDVCISHVLRDVEDAIPYILDDETFSSQDVCILQARRDVKDAIPYGLFFHNGDQHIYKTNK